MKYWNSERLNLFQPVAFAAAIFIMMPVATYAQDANLKSVIDRLERLERDIRTLNAHLSRGGEGSVKLSSESSASSGMSGPAVARVGLRIDRLEQDLRSTTGVLEEINHRTLQVSDRLDKLVSDIDFRLSSLESGGSNAGQPQPMTQFGQSQGTAAGGSTGVEVQAMAPVGGGNAPDTLGTVSVSTVKKIQDQGPAQTAPVQPIAPVQTAAVPTTSPVVTPPPAAPVGALPAGTPKEQYTYAFNLLQQTNFDQAALALNSFIETNPDDPLAANARYWLGETYYVRRMYQDAAQTFYNGYQKNPTGPKAPDSLLKLGMSLAGLGKKDDACAAFAKVLSDFAKASAGVKNKVAREIKTNGCT
jgi:tol-pal system protein YbgF